MRHTSAPQDGPPMRCWTMRPVEIMLALGVVLSCTRATPAKAAPAGTKTLPAVASAVSPASGTSDKARDPAAPLVKIVAFDCEKLELLPGDPPPSGLVAAGAGIRGWTNGGPSGAAWN